MSAGRTANFELWLRSQMEPAKLLLVEDEEGVQMLVRDLSAAYHCEWSMADNGERGYDLAVNGDFRLIFVDIMLPSGMNGLELVRRLKDKDVKSAMVVISGYISSEVIWVVSKLGFVPLVTKPTCFDQKFMDDMFMAFNIPKKPKVEALETVPMI
jgi:DNA-binding response OmpR family regulator